MAAPDRLAELVVLSIPALVIAIPLELLGAALRRGSAVYLELKLL